MKEESKRSSLAQPKTRIENGELGDADQELSRTKTDVVITSENQLEAMTDRQKSPPLRS